MQRNKQIVFHLFRYQILPTSKIIQMQFVPPIQSLEELIANKNIFFGKALGGVKSIHYARAEVTHKAAEVSKEVFLIKFAVKRSLKRSTKDFRQEQIDNWPAISVVINNHPEVQKVAIQFDRRVFAETENVADILQDEINRELKKYQLHVIFEKMFEESAFWEIIAAHENRIKQIEFELVSPNLANISKSLQFDLKQLSRSTNTQITKLQLNSDKDATLNISKEDGFVAGLVEYSADGGGKINLKVRGLSKKIRTTDRAVEMVVDEVDFNQSKPADIIKILKEMAK